MRGARNNRGLTLLEMLVVLTLVGLFSILLLQGLSFILQLHDGFLRAHDRLHRGSLQSHWFYRSTAGLTVDYSQQEDNHVFKGDPDGFAGLTLAPLQAEAGSLLPFAWRLEKEANQSRLIYRMDEKNTWTIMQWPDTEVFFRYLDKQDAWHENWPPQGFGQQAPQLPVAIMLSRTSDLAPMNWIVRLSDQDKPPMDIRHLLWQPEL